MVSLEGCRTRPRSRPFPSSDTRAASARSRCSIVTTGRRRGGEKRRRERDVPDVPARAARSAERAPRGRGRARAASTPARRVPDPAPILLIRQRELDRDVQPADERVVHVASQVRRQNRDAVVLLHALEQVADLDVGVAVVRVLTSLRLPKSASASSKKRIAFARSAAAKTRARFFSVSPMYLLTDRGEIDLVEIEPELARDDLRGHRLARAGRAGEEHVQPLAEGELVVEAPLVVAPARRYRA